MQQLGSPALAHAKTLLMIPDLFNFLLTGNKVNEFTDATTSQFLNPTTRQWSTRLLEQFGLPTDILQPIAHPGTNLGALLPKVASATGLKNVDVILPGAHDTASAVMAVPTECDASDSPNWCYISSGTWSLMGAEVTAPVIGPTCQRHNFTNEGGVGGTIRLLKNITGLWLVQECRRVWAEAGRDYSWSELVEKAQESPALRSMVDPDDASFATPTDMPEAIREYCRRTSQPVPKSEGMVIRCALESMAVKYRRVLEMLEELTGSTTTTIHIVGGGAQNRELCQMAADACDRQVITGPVEATAIGNVMMQAIACGDVDSVSAARAIIKQSFPVETFHPNSTPQWRDARIPNVAD